MTEDAHNCHGCEHCAARLVASIAAHPKSVLIQVLAETMWAVAADGRNVYYYLSMAYIIVDFMPALCYGETEAVAPMLIVTTDPVPSMRRGRIPLTSAGAEALACLLKYDEEAAERPLSSLTPSELVYLAAAADRLATMARDMSLGSAAKGDRRTGTDRA